MASKESVPNKDPLRLKEVYSNMRIFHIRVHTFYYDTRALSSSNKLRIYDIDKHEQVKIILFYKSVTESNIFLFNPAVPKINHS